MRSYEEIMKALHAIVGGNPSDLVPEKIDPILAELADRATPIRKLLKRKQWTNLDYAWRERTALPGNAFYDEDDAQGSTGMSDSTFQSRSERIKMLKAEGGVTKLLQIVSRDLIDAKQTEIEGAVKSLALGEEWGIINGDTGSSAKEFNGLIQQIGSVAGSVIDASGSLISFDLLDQAIQEVTDAGGVADLIIVASRDLLKLSALMRAAGLLLLNQGNTGVSAGVRVKDYLGVPVVSSIYMPTNLGPYADYGCAIICDTSEIVVPEALGVTMEDLPTTKDEISFRVKQYSSLAVRSRTKQRIITNLGNPA